MSANKDERELADGKSSDLVQGTLEMLILKTLALEPMHGYGVALRIEQISKGVFRVNPGSLLPALSRMERCGHVKSGWRATENNRRAKYYELTAKGHKIELMGAFSSAMGGGQVVLRDFSKGVNFGASDPRKDGAAIPELPVE